MVKGSAVPVGTVLGDPEADGAPVPFLDLAAINGEVRDEIDEAFHDVVRHGRFVGGLPVEQFEQAFAAYCGASDCVGVANGTDALELILAALGVGAGDEVIVPANTFVASVEAVLAVGARPRFVDVLPDTLLVDPAAVDAAVNAATAAILVVHLYGQMADVTALQAVAGRHGLSLVEDAAQAHGAAFDRRRAGSIGVAAGFSFYPGKNLGALGDAGAVVTSDRALGDRVRRLANHGRTVGDRHLHDLRGRNSRLDALQAAVLLAKLGHLDRSNARRVGIMEQYRAQLPASCRPLGVDARADPVHHLAVVRAPDRPRIIEALDAHRIGWGLHYPVPCHLQPAFAEFRGVHEQFPVTEDAAHEILSLPMSPTLRPDQVARVCRVIEAVAP